MKKVEKLILVLLLTIGFHSFALASNESVDPDLNGGSSVNQPVDSSATTPVGAAAADGGAGSAGQQSQSQQNQFSNCQDAGAGITFQCSSTPGFAEAQVTRGIMAKFTQSDKDPGAKERAEEAAAETSSSLDNMTKVRNACTKAFSDCQNVCNQESRYYYNQMLSIANPQQKAQYNASQYQPRLTQNNSTIQSCKNEYEKTMAKSAMAMADMGKILESAMGLIAALGGKSDSGGMSSFDTASTDKDVCELAGDDAKYMPSCTGVGEPKGTRGGSLATTGVGGLSGSGDGSSLMTASQGDPGGDPKGTDKSGSGFTGFGSSGAGFGSLGGSDNSGSGSGGADSINGLDSEIHKGFIGASGSGGGGGFSGGSGSKGGFGKFSAGGAGNPQAAALNKKINKLKQAQTAKRKPASSGGANGPFEDNWGVVSKAYKKNSKSMFHQK